jgi:hypothetical protein
MRRGGAKGGLHTFLKLILTSSEWSASRPGHLTSWERALYIYWAGGWMSNRVSYVVREVEKVPALNRNLNSTVYFIAGASVSLMFSSSILLYYFAT